MVEAPSSANISVPIEDSLDVSAGCASPRRSSAFEGSISTAGGDAMKTGCRWLYLSMQLVYTLCNFSSLILFAVYKHWEWFVPLLCLILFNLFSYWRAGTCFRRWLGQSVPKRHSLERFLEGIPFATAAFYALYTGHLPRCWFVAPGESNGPFTVLFTISGALSIVFMALAAMDIDEHASSEVSSQLESSRCMRTLHLLYRGGELCMRLTGVAFLFILMRPVLGQMLPHVGPLTAPLTLFLIIAAMCSYNMVVFTVASCKSGLPRDPIVALALASFVGIAMNPFFFLDRPGYKAGSSNARLLIFCLRFVEAFLLAGFFFILGLNVEFKPFDGDLCKDMEGQTLFKYLVKTGVFPKMMCQLVVPGAVHYIIMLFVPYGRAHFFRGAAETTVPLLPFEPGQTTAVQSQPQIGLANFLIRLSGGGVLARLVPQTAIRTSDFVVERVLGAGNYGVVVCVRQEREHGHKMASLEQRRFALKLQNTETPPNFHPAIAEPTELALRERSIYEQVWRTVNAATGRNGCPFILRHECSFDWPEGVEFAIASSKERVEWIRDDNTRDTTFHCALMMELCPEGDLQRHILTHMRRGIDDETAAGSQEWFRRAQRFTAEILLGLAFLHDIKIVYRDLKPENVLVVMDQSKQLHVKLADFGFSKLISRADPSKSLAGSPYFSPPEMYEIAKNKQQQPLDGSSVDIFSLGMMVFVMWYGCDLWKKSARQFVQPQASLGGDDKNHRWLSAAVQEKRPDEENLRSLCRLPRCPRDVCQVVWGCVKTQPGERLTLQKIKESSLFQTLTVAGEQVPQVSWDALQHLMI